MNEPTHLDLFSGIGGFALGAESVGFRTIGFSEIDPYASAVLRKHWPNVPNYGDIRNITGEGIGPVDIITGGFPCQPFSVAGKRCGDSDERHLWPELVRILGEVRPRFALFENVPGLLSISGGRVFNGVLSDLCKIGYDCIWNLVPASAVGAPHRRDRIWIIAVANVCSNPTRGGGMGKEESIQAVDREKNSSTWESSGTTSESKTLAEKSQYAANNSSNHELSNPNSMCKQNVGNHERGFQQESTGDNKNVTDAEGQRLQGSIQQDGGKRTESHDERVKRCSGEWDENWFEAATKFCGMDDGFPNRVDRLRCLGNGIVPQVAQIFLKEIYKQVT